MRKLRSMGVDADQWIAALNEELDVGSSDSLPLPFSGSYQWLRTPAEPEHRVSVRRRRSSTNTGAT